MAARYVVASESGLCILHNGARWAFLVIIEGRLYRVGFFVQYLKRMRLNPLAFRNVNWKHGHE